MTERERRIARARKAKRLREKRRKRRILLTILIGIVLVIVVTIGYCAVHKNSQKKAASSKVEETKSSKEDTKTSTKTKEKKPEDDIYTYLQGIRSYESQKLWTGKWCYDRAGDSQFSSFGCGLCSIANVVSTVKGNEVDPQMTFDKAKEVSSYAPTTGAGAIGWNDMKTTLEYYEVDGDLKNKDETYEEFQEAVKSHVTMIALVSSNNDDTYWQNVPGHYISIWLYNEETDEVFLADSAKPSHNRKWIPLRYVYDALKTSSDYQYMVINDNNSV